MRTAHPSQSWWKRLLNWRLMLPINLVLIGFIGYSLAREMNQADQIDTQLADLNKEINSLQSQNTDYTGLISRLGTSSFVEREARLKLNYQKPGEHTLVLRDSTVSSTLSPAPIDDSAPESNPGKWWVYFVGN